MQSALGTNVNVKKIRSTSIRPDLATIEPYEVWIEMVKAHFGIGGWTLTILCGKLDRNTGVSRLTLKGPYLVARYLRRPGNAYRPGQKLLSLFCVDTEDRAREFAGHALQLQPVDV